MSSWILCLSTQFGKHTNCGSLGWSQTRTSIPGYFCNSTNDLFLSSVYSLKTHKQITMVEKCQYSNFGSSSCLLCLVLMTAGCLHWTFFIVCLCLQWLQDWKRALDSLHQLSWYSPLSMESVYAFSLGSLFYVRKGRLAVNWCENDTLPRNIGLHTFVAIWWDPSSHAQFP